MEHDLFDKRPRHNALVLYALSGMDVVSTYLCVGSGLQEANPVIRMFYGSSIFYDSIVPGMVMHLILYGFITLFVAYAAQYLRGWKDGLGTAILVGYAAILCLIAFNNILLLTGVLTPVL